MTVMATSLAMFQSTLPMKGATYKMMEHGSYFLFQSTLPMKGATNRRQ